ncbi:polysaccharide lyase 8 family protein [Gryllotalpicola koreensis]|uniref:Polysaccharide lyase 8 family protein n=1 Tax=Gryllotalpicola koreensis TaxID=993086 RepID=A0ABP8A155_9MICO
MNQEASPFSISRRTVMLGAVAAATLVATDAFAGPWTVPARAATVDDFDRFRLQWLATLVADYDTGDAALVAYVEDTAAVASGFWRGATPLNTSTSRSYLWSDLESTTVSAEMTSTIVRLRQLALALKTPGSSLSDSAELKADILSALDWFLGSRYNLQKSYDNWWDWQIGTPQALNDVCVLMYDDLAPGQLATAMAAIAHYEPDPAVTGGTTSTGANRNWACAITMLRGALSRDQATIDSARLKLETIFPYASSGDGMYPDGGFVQHVYYAYTAGYGVSLLQVLSYMMVSAVDTPWAFSSAQTAEVFDWTQNNFAPWIYGGGFMDMLHGRGISRFYETDRRIGRLALGVLLQLAGAFPAESARVLRSQLKGWLTSYDSYSFAGGTPGEQQPSFFTYDPVPIQQVSLPSVVLGRQLMNDTSIPAAAESTRTVISTSMARAVHRRPGFAMGFAMETKAIRPYESANGENLMGWYQGEGAVYLYVPSQLGHWANEWWPTANKCRIPGTTVVQKQPVLGKAQRSTVTNTWAGGALLDGNAAVGMGLKFLTQPLTAKKSWFCIGDAIVCLGAGVTSTDGNTIETIIEQRNIGPNGKTVPVIDGTPFTKLGSSPTSFTPSWAHIPKAGGYLFPVVGTRVQAIREDRTGRWTDMDNRGTYEDDTLYSRRFITFWFDHGVDPQNDTYAYIQLPGAAQADVEAAAQTMAGVTIFANTAQVQAVSRDGLTMANFWDAGAPVTNGISVSAPVSVIVSRKAGELVIAVSDPTKALTDDVMVTVQGSAKHVVAVDSGVTVLQTKSQVSIRVAVASAAGKTFVARFSRS